MAVVSPRPGKVVCVGRSYAAHAAELNNPVPEEPLLFIKPGSCVQGLDGMSIPTDRGDVHYEAELALWLAAPLTKASAEDAWAAVGGIGLAMDLTLRDKQTELKKKGWPWEVAKSFDGACALGPQQAVPADLPMQFTLDINGNTVQAGDTAMMLFALPGLLSEMSQHFTLEVGDVVLTGTPAGVGVLKVGDRLAFMLNGQPYLETTVTQA
ncbi:fumarylacetoacetate hydrolase family protein [Salinispirillum marinum]|uniref:Fumarylacetoacetate hydrolase family protein n=2 Tax=Saccharospirillaceae TaxID=255527 RepID=A0ABV8BJS5_9GAMM